MGEAGAKLERTADEGVPPWIDPIALPLGDHLLDRNGLDAVIGEGATSRVYEALDEKPGGVVAIKVLDLSRAHAELLEQRFLREARIGVSLEHPNIARVYELGRVPDTGVPYLVMERLEGRTLLEEMKARPQRSFAEALEILGPVAEAVSAAHAAGVVHRDIKPANVFLTPDGPKLLDFGISIRTGDVRLTDPSAVVGTPSNLAPEQIQLVESDHRVDVYALGVLLYRLVCGRAPFHGRDPLSLMTRIVTEEPTPPSELVEGISSMMDAVVMRALAKRPEQRFASVDALMTAARVALRMPVVPKAPSRGDETTRRERGQK